MAIYKTIVDRLDLKVTLLEQHLHLILMVDRGEWTIDDFKSLLPRTTRANLIRAAEWLYFKELILKVNGKYVAK